MSLFHEPAWLYGLLSLPVLAALVCLLAWRRKRLWARLAHERTAPRIDLTVRDSRPAWRGVLIVVAVGLMFLALARPRLGETDEEISTEGLDLIVALDLSQSMLTEDVAPSRLQVARELALSLAGDLASDRIGLVGFAGNAAELCPLTLDRRAFELYVRAAEPGLFDSQGTDLGAAIETAQRMFERRGIARRVLVIISDGEDHEQGLEAAASAAAEAGIRIDAIAIGTESGGPVPERDADGTIRGYKRDRDGQIVTSVVNPESLKTASRIGGGVFVRASGTGDDVEKVVNELQEIERSELLEMLPARRAERYRWPLAAAVLLVFLEAALIDRRRPRR